MQDDGGMKAGFQRPSTRHGAQAMILPRHGAQGMALRHTLIDDVAAHALALGLLLVTVLVQRLEHKMETTGGKSKEDGSPAGSPPRGNSADGRTRSVATRSQRLPMWQNCRTGCFQSQRLVSGRSRRLERGARATSDRQWMTLPLLPGSDSVLATEASGKVAAMP